MSIEYLGLSEINGPLVVLDHLQGASYEEIVEFTEIKDLLEDTENEAIEETVRNKKWHIDTVLINTILLKRAGLLEEINNHIQEMKRRTKGFRNVDYFISMIYLEAGSLKINTIC